VIFENRNQLTHERSVRRKFSQTARQKKIKNSQAAAVRFPGRVGRLSGPEVEIPTSDEARSGSGFLAASR
jgi:hypothetical protein